MLITIPLVTPLWNRVSKVREEMKKEIKGDISEGGMLTEEAEEEAKAESEAEETTEDEVEVEEPEEEESETPDLSEEEAAEEEKFQEELENPTEDNEEKEEEREEPKKEIVLPPEPGQEVNEPMVLEQFECKDCGKRIYVREDDNQDNSSQFLCPFCEMDSKRVRKLDMIIKKFEDLK